VADDAAVLLVGAGKETRYVDEREQRHVERVARAHEPRRLLRGVDVETPREHLRLVPDDADRVAVETREPAHHVHRPQGEHFEEVTVVDDFGDDLLHVVRPVGRVGHDIDERVARSLDVIGRFEVRRVLEVVGG
jgi:hypothetical protein